jgi:hypothetical protein
MRDESDHGAGRWPTGESDAGDASDPGGRAQQAREYAEQCRLPGAVRAEESETATGLYREIDSVDRSTATERAVQARRIDDGSYHLDRVIGSGAMARGREAAMTQQYSAGRGFETAAGRHYSENSNR